MSTLAQQDRRGGRAPRSDVPSTKRVEFLVTPSERADLARVAADAGLPLAAVIREAVNVFVADYGERLVFFNLQSSGKK